MKRIFTLLALLFFTSNIINAQLINEFEPNPNGADPSNQNIELLGTPGSSFSGFVLTLEGDSGIGTIDSRVAVSGTFDSNGLLVISIPDVENPTFTLVLSSICPPVGTDLDTDNDGVIDTPSDLGTVYDAIGVPDAISDEANLYGTGLGGADFSFTGDEPMRIFRDANTEDWYAVNDDATETDAYDIDANPIPYTDFDLDPTTTNFGSVNSILPVDLINITAKNNLKLVTISWATATEINNSHFNIQHSADGERFQTIGEVEGNGNSNRLNSYSFDHNAPIAGLNYYRLEQVDYDGVNAFSKIVKTNNSTSYTRNYIIQSNVVSNDIFLNVDEFTTVQVKDMSGKTIINASIAQAGSINVSNLNAGMYLVVLNTNGVINTEKIIKQ